MPIDLSYIQQLSPWNIGFKKQPPDLIIAGGRQAVHVAWWFRKVSKTVILQNPKCNLRDFSVVIAPEHDGIKGAPNLITTQGCLCLERNFNSEIPWKNLPKPWCGLLLGGNSRHYTYNIKDIERITSHLLALKHSLIITASRRTPKAWLLRLLDAIKEKQYWIWDETSINPYPAILKTSDRLVVTNDSISMLSEACSTGKPVHMIDFSLKTTRILSFSKSLNERGYATFLGTDSNFVPKNVLDEKNAIKDRLMALLRFDR